MITGPCARHTCGRDAGDHADMRTPRGQRLFRGVPLCHGTAPIIVTAASGVQYQRDPAWEWLIGG